ncbi:hypothetical protein [Campylobacter sp.]|nr:hypothetical protein [Campylobacter sp.]MDY3246362.1 hypothetical protein [Campylobacter sp.]
MKIENEACFHKEKMMNSDDHKLLIDRMEFILNEYEFNVLQASQFLDEKNSRRLDLILNFKEYPSFEFLKNFANKFKISYEWLINPKDKQPFNNIITKIDELIFDNSRNSLINECKDYKELYLICSKQRNRYTKLIIENNYGEFQVFKQDFNILYNTNGIGANSERGMRSLFDFYNSIKNIKDIEKFHIDDFKYDKIINKENYIGKLLKQAEHCTELNDLLTLDDYNISRYEENFRTCFKILKDYNESKHLL